MIFPPQHCPNQSEWRKDGRTTIPLYCCWGNLRIPAQVWESRLKQEEQHMALACDASLDQSGYTPQALDHLVTLARLLNYEEAAELAVRLGLQITSSRLQRVVAPVAEEVRQQIRHELETQALEPLIRITSVSCTNRNNTDLPTPRP